MNFLNVELIGAHVPHNVVALNKFLEGTMLSLQLIFLIEHLLLVTSDGVGDIFFVEEGGMEELNVGGMRDRMEAILIQQIGSNLSGGAFSA